MFKDYCLKHGQFMNPSSVTNMSYKEVVSCFKKYDTYNQMIFYCKPYCKVQTTGDKRAGGQVGLGYGDTISRPTFIAQEANKEKEIFLNGEVNQLPSKLRHDQMIRKTQLCLKGIMVDSQLGREALKNYFNMVHNK